MGVVAKPYIGSLDRRIKILKVVKVKDTTGQEKSVAQRLCEPWASLVDQNGGEQVDMAVMELSSRAYVIRWRKEIEQSGFEMQVEDNGIVYRIIHVGIINRRQYLQLRCTVYEQ